MKTAINDGLLQTDLDCAGFDLLNFAGTEAANGIPAGGTTGQLLKKLSATDFDTDWATVVSGGGALPEGWVSVTDYGAVADARVVTDAAMTSGSAVLTSATAVFTSGDVGKKVSINGVGAAGAILATTISGFTNSTTVTLATTAGTSASAQYCAYGTDNTAPVQAAIAAATSTVFFPAGRYLFAGSIGALPISISLVGANQFGPSWAPLDLTPPPYGNPMEYGGTILLLTANAGNATGTKFITLSSNSAVVGLMFYWPNQLTTNAVAIAYPWAIYLHNTNSASVRFCTFVNAYQGILAERAQTILIEEIRGEVLNCGIRFSGHYAVSRVKGCYFDNQWGGGAAIEAYRTNNAIAFDMGRNDFTILDNCFAYVYNKWIRCYDDPGPGGPSGPGGSSWVYVRGGGADACQTPVWIDQGQMQGIDLDGTYLGYGTLRITSAFAGSVRIHNSMFFQGGGQFAIVEGIGDVTMDNCYFESVIGITPPTFATTGVAVTGTGNFTLRDCTFHTIQPYLSLGASLNRAIVVGNMCSDTTFSITNSMTAGFVIANNTGGTAYVGTDARLVPVSGGVKLEARNTGTGVWVEAARWTNP